MTQVARSQQIQRTGRVGVVIPVYGEDESILWVLGRFEKKSVDTICLVVDVPKKRVLNRIRGFDEQTGMSVHIIKNSGRRGIGYCLRQGLNYLMETDHSVAVIMAGNGKDDPREMRRLLEPVIGGECDYVQ